MLALHSALFMHLPRYIDSLVSIVIQPVVCISHSSTGEGRDGTRECVGYDEAEGVVGVAERWVSNE